MSYFTRGPAKLIENENKTQIPSDIYDLLVALETVHANFAGMKDSLNDAGRLLVNFKA
jgi:hypothetical protein